MFFFVGARCRGNAYRRNVFIVLTCRGGYSNVTDEWRRAPFKVASTAAVDALPDPNQVAVAFRTSFAPPSGHVLASPSLAAE